MTRLRRLRWLPVLLTLLSPAVGGELLPLLHPCPVEQPWSAGVVAPDAVRASHDAAHAHHAAPNSGDQQRAPSHDHGGTGSCSCLGSCHTPGVITPPSAPLVAMAVESVTPLVRSWFAIEAATVAPLSELLPPKTAPPIA